METTSFKRIILSRLLIISIAVHLLDTNMKLLMLSSTDNIYIIFVEALAYSLAVAVFLELYPRLWAIMLVAAIDAAGVYIQKTDFINALDIRNIASIYFALYTFVIVAITGLIKLSAMVTQKHNEVINNLTTHNDKLSTVNNNLVGENYKLQQIVENLKATHDEQQQAIKHHAADTRRLQTELSEVASSYKELKKDFLEFMQDKKIQHAPDTNRFKKIFIELSEPTTDNDLPFANNQ